MKDVFEYYALNGGIINGAIFIVAVVVLYIGLGKVILYRSVGKKTKQYKTDSGNIACYDLLHEVFVDNVGHSTEFYKNAFREKLLEIVPRLDAGLDTMATLIQAAPFLGLYGTVAGMIETFSLMTTYGTGNPVVLTEGITVSLLTTQAGLLVAFPCMLFHNYICGRKHALVQDILSQGEKLITIVSKNRGKNSV